MATKPSLILILFGIFINFTLFIGTDGVHVELFKHDNFTGLLWKISSTLKTCHNVPEERRDFAYSIRTDTCILVYNRRDCKNSSDVSTKFMPGNISLSSDRLIEYTWISSIQTCNEEEGGSQLNVDITEHYNWKSSFHLSVFESYKNLCSCVNIPEYVQNMPKWSINNHHNALYAYLQSDCKETSRRKFISAGYNKDSRNMHDREKVYSSSGINHHFKSLGPDPNSDYFQNSCKAANSDAVTQVTKSDEKTTENKRFINILVISNEHGPKFQFFRDENFTELVWETNATEECTTIPWDIMDEMYSIKTDTCFIAYGHKDCESNWSKKYLTGDSKFSKDEFGRYGWIRSFHACNEDEGGDQLNVKIFEFNVHTNRTLGLLDNYKNVCSCINIPEYSKENEHWWIDNLHNDMLVYYEPDCTQDKLSSQRISGIETHETQNRGYYLSSGPDPESTYFQKSCGSDKILATEGTKPNLNILIKSDENGAKLQLYRRENFTNNLYSELVWESESTKVCGNIPKEHLVSVYSIKTDTCFIAYNDFDCKSESSAKFRPGNETFSPLEFGRHLWIVSFQMCNEEEGGNQLNLDITRYLGNSDLSPEVLQNYKNVCSCVNVPESIQNLSEWSINNHHNSLLAFYLPNCQVDDDNGVTLISSGHNYFSRHNRLNLGPFSPIYVSLAPNPMSLYFQKSCKKSAKILVNEKTEEEETDGLLNILIVSGDSGVNLKLYKTENFTDLVWESKSTSGCTNFPTDRNIEINSIKTDTCFIIYTDPNCEWNWSKKFLPGSYHRHGKDDLISSFQICDDQEGGSQLHVDITKLDNPSEVIQSYKNVCSCVNIPENLQNRTTEWSINNHHNSMFLYLQSDCRESSRRDFIAAGQKSRRMYQVEHLFPKGSVKHRYKSFGPDPNSTYFKNSCDSDKNVEITQVEKLDKRKTEDAHVLHILMNSGENGVTFQLFRKQNFTELVWETTAATECTTLPYDIMADVYSIETDTCFIAYYHPNCVSPFRKKYTIGDFSKKLGRYAWIRSFELCNEEEGGNQLNIDIVRPYDGLQPYVLESYRNVCSCVNVPTYFKHEMLEWSTDNHHNSFIAYYEPKCAINKWNSKRIPAREIYDTTFIDNFKSFGPDPNAAYYQISCNSGKIIPANVMTKLVQSISISSGENGLNFKLIRNENFNFKEIGWESNSIEECNNIPMDKQGPVFSIKTDTCFIAYNDFNCESDNSAKYLPGEMYISSDKFGRSGWIRSFHTCNEEEGGDQLNVDITAHNSHDIVSQVLESYKNVCSCINVPESVQNMHEWNIDNHHNAMLAYYEPDCGDTKWNSVYIPAGHNEHSREVHKYKKIEHKIQSFGPDPNSTYFKISCNPGNMPSES